MDEMFDCTNCGREWPADRFNRESVTPDWCFACRSKTIHTAFQGGKQYFHNGTGAERARKAVSEAKAAGFDPVPAETGKAWNAASGAAFRKLETFSAKKVGSE